MAARLQRATRSLFLLACGAWLALLAGCAQLVPQTVQLRTSWPQGVPQQVELAKVPFFPQVEYQCGPAALATVLAHSGVPITPEPLVEQVWVPARKGSLQLEMLAAARRNGRVSYRLAPSYADLLREVAAGNPVIVLQDIGFMPLLPQWHYAVVNGFDYETGTLYLRSGTEPRKAMPFTAFERTWIRGGYWAMVVLPPDRLAATADEERWLEAVLALSRTAPPATAAQAYRAALARWPGNLPAAIGLANHLHAGGELAEAATVLRRTLQRHPQSVIAMNNLAQTLSDQGRQREALAQVDKALQADSPFADEVRATRQMILQRMNQQKSGSR